MMHVFFKFGGRDDDAYISSRENLYHMLYNHVTSCIIRQFGLWVVWYVYFDLFGCIPFAMRIWKISYLRCTYWDFEIQCIK